MYNTGFKRPERYPAVFHRYGNGFCIEIHPCKPDIAFLFKCDLKSIG